MLEKFSFGDLLRYGFSGGAFLLAMQLSRVGFDSVTSPGFKVKEGAAILFVSVLIGSFIYSLHRAIFHRPINHLCNWILDRTFADTKLANAKTYLEDTFRRDYARWIRRCNYPTFHQSMDKWASQIHFLYCFAIATGAGAIIGRILRETIRGKGWSEFWSTPGRATFWCLLVLAGISFSAGLRQDYIATYYDRRLLRKNLRKDVDRGAHVDLVDSEPDKE